tara:strand:- start:8 stop:601 length:594 start_codon:yes stop_codon:yes gene_type:complete
MKITIIIIISFLVIGMYSFKNSMLNVHNIAPNNVDLNSYNEDFYNLSAKSIDGEIINFSKYKGKKILIVNVASKCGYTPQYEDLQVLHKKYGDKVTILAFPSNNFGFQEPGSNDEIIEFCESKYGVEFQLFEKTDVRGKNSHPVYKWLSTVSSNGWNDKSPRWNFFKYLIDESGELSGVYSSSTTPLDKEIVDFILN